MSSFSLQELLHSSRRLVLQLLDFIAEHQVSTGKSDSDNSSNPLNSTISSGHTPLTPYVKSNPKFDTPPNSTENLCILFS